LLTSVSPLKGDVIALLSTAFATDGAILSVAPQAKIDKPIHLIFLSTGSSPRLCALQNAISIGEGAEVSLIETHAAAGQAQTIALTRLTIGAHAALKHIRVNTGLAAKHLSSTIARLGEKTEYDPLQMTVNGVLTRAQANIRFEGADARCHYTGAMMVRGQSHADFTLVVEHAAVGCESRELVKAVLDGRSRGVFQGKVIVERGAQKTDGKQMANALLLSDDAEFDSKPELEIYADDVACGHGATAGQLDEDLMFYLRARGLPEIEARALLIAAFVGAALDKVENEALHEALQEKVDAWLSA
jgi:Fe-S cluster assembly protein SufD